MSKSFVYLMVGIFGTIGGYIPVLFGADGFGGWSIIGGLVGGIFGIFVAFKMSGE